ncbi:hypothetical protein LTR84_006863 [Exophiala bonariae]|uniref:Methyltransferase domain-containing protein n=1 Tax=Exophiala bonariae TaxID=1690606 RepID=A0AAV9N3G8_9EURO|nr:hypothetical protein LTR84_006863 [Exophiala bonariae]
MAESQSNRYDRKITYLEREYQDYSFRREIYLAPIDLVSSENSNLGVEKAHRLAQEEETRLQDQHEMLKLIYHDWDNALHPNFIQDPEAILDCGFGSGNWAYDLAEYDSNCSRNRGK